MKFEEMKTRMMDLMPVEILSTGSNTALMHCLYRRASAKDITAQASTFSLHSDHAPKVEGAPEKHYLVAVCEECLLIGQI